MELNSSGSQRYISLKLLIVIAIIAIFASCSEYSRVLKSSDFNLKYDKALKLYEKKDYQKALPLFEELLTVYRGTSKAEKLYFYYAYCHYGTDDYAMGNYYFENFLGTFPTSSYAEEAAYMVAYCLYKDSPRYNLDPTNTMKAINEMQYFINKYPRSSRVEECNKIIEELRDKLEKKTFTLAQLYFNIENYNSAIIAFKNLLRDYPDTKYNIDANFYILKSHFKYAQRSVDTKKQQRYEETINFYYTFVDKYSKSKYIKEAEQIYASSIKEIESLKKKNS